jgi:DnaK suppressor protein
VNAQARKPAPKKPAAKKAVKKPVVAKKPVAKKAAPAKKAVVKKPVVKKPAAKPAAKPSAKTAAKKPVKAVAKKVTKPVAKKVVAKKPTPVKAKASAKPVAKKGPAKVAKPVVKAAAKPAKTAAKASVKPTAKPVAKANAKVTAKVVAKSAHKAAPKEVPKAVPKVADKKPSKEAKVKEVKAAAPAPVVHTTPIIPGYTPVVHKKNSRAAKMAALVPPPPAQVVASTAAKSSFMPMAAPAVSTIVPVIPKKDAKLANNWKTKTADQLTDAEVIAMPDGEYMNDIQMAFFRLKLVQLKNEVLSNASETTEHLREDTVVVPDPADRATIEEEHALELRTRDRERKLLKKIEQSINRIDAGDYGYCDETGEAIGVGRLLARPTATLSLEAQERRELKQKMFGD